MSDRSTRAAPRHTLRFRLGKMDDVLLQPNHGRYDPKHLRWQYEGSSLEISSKTITWTPPTHRPYNRAGFSVPVGSTSGQAHTMTRVQARFPSRFDSGIVDQYVVTDSAGGVLGWFPSGWGKSGSAVPEHLKGWYPPQSVRTACHEAGLVYLERDFGSDGAALDTEFPSVAPHVRRLQRLLLGQCVVYIVVGALLIGLAVALATSPDVPGRFVVMLIPLAAGVLNLLGGVVLSPWGQRRATARRARSERAATG